MRKRPYRHAVSISVIILLGPTVREGVIMKDYESHPHISQSDRFVIERMLMSGRSFKEIACKINRHPSSISREIRANRNFILTRTTLGNDCSLSNGCFVKNLCEEEGCWSRCVMCKKKDCREYCDKYIPVHCKKLDRKPYVCNLCKDRSGCKLNHAYYNAHTAHANARRTLSSSRSGIQASSEKLHELDKLLTPLIKRGQSLSHIFASHADEIGYSRKTIYNYINAHALTAKNIDLPRKVRYKKRKLNYHAKVTYKYRIGRTYLDYKTYMAEHPELSAVEMDTVKGTREKGNVLLTFVFCQFSFMLIFIIPSASQECVLSVFNHLTKELGISLFRKLFPVILTDNGCEFKDVNALEYTSNGADRTKLFYCDPQASWQKPHIEKCHEFIRYVVPQGRSFDAYNQQDMTLLNNHINSFARDSLDGKCPFTAAKGFLGDKMLDSLNLQLVPPDDVVLKPMLLKH